MINCFNKRKTKVLTAGVIIINSNIMWNEFHNKMEQVFGKSFRQVDDLYYDISKEVNFGENVELNDNKALKYLQDLHIKIAMCLDMGFLYRHQDGVLAKNTFYGIVHVFVVSL